MIALPENWSDWNVIGEIGRGSFSVVYEAERKDDPSVRCAIKVITVPQDDSEYDDLIADGFNTQLSRSFFAEAVKDFTREIRLMEHFKGMQNIVSIEDYKVIPKEDGIGSHIFIRMELLTSLEKYINDKTLTEDEIIQIGVDICTALEFCQDKQIIHRDIKPANIFVNDRLGTHVFYKLGDFGIARNLEGKTQDLSSKGTPNYMAPEVAANMKYNSTADIYSLGLTLYWLMNANRLPFFPQTQLYTPSAKREALQRRLSGEQIEPPVNASPELSDIILKACSYHPVDRYQQASEMKKALLKLQSTREQKALAGSYGDNTERSRSRQESKHKNHLIGVLSAAALLVVVAYGVFALLDHKLKTTKKTDTLTTETPTLSAGVVVTDIPELFNPPEASEPTPTPTETPTPTLVPTEEAIAVLQVSESSVITAPMPDLSEFTETPESDFKYEMLSDETVKITKYTGSGEIEKLLLPSTIEGHVVSTLGRFMFSENKIREIVIPDNVTHIAEAAFGHCDELIRLWLPRNLKTIERNPFVYAPKLQEVYLSDDNPDFRMVDGILYDKNMEQLLACVPGRNESIFRVPDSVKRIGPMAFHDQRDLKKVFLPDNLEEIGDYAFCYTGLVTMEIPDTLEYLGAGAFSGAYSLQSVNIPEKCTVIGGHTFFQCNSLRKIELPEKTISIGEEAFSGCSSLSVIRLPDGVVSIGNRAFAECAGLTSFVIPKSVRIIEGNPFPLCTALDTIIVEEGNDRFYFEEGVLFDKADQRLLSYSASKDTTRYSIPEGTRVIEKNAFYGNSSLKEVFLPNSLEVIGEEAFKECIGLETVSLSDNIYEIGDFAFMDCWQLRQIHLPASLEKLNRELFRGCWSLTEVILPEKLKSIGMRVFAKCDNLKRIEIPMSVTEINNWAFEECEQLMLIVTSGSYAEQFCIGSGMNYQVLENEETSVLPPTQEQTSFTEKPAEAAVTEKPMEEPAEEPVGEPTEEPFPEWLLED